MNSQFFQFGLEVNAVSTPRAGLFIYRTVLKIVLSFSSFSFSSQSSNSKHHNNKHYSFILLLFTMIVRVASSVEFSSLFGQGVYAKHLVHEEDEMV